MGYFTILATIPGFFLSSLIFSYLHGSLGCYCPKFRNSQDRLSHGYVDNYHPLVSGGTSSCGWPKSKKVVATFLG